MKSTRLAYQVTQIQEAKCIGVRLFGCHCSSASMLSLHKLFPGARVGTAILEQPRITAPPVPFPPPWNLTFHGFCNLFTAAMRFPVALHDVQTSLFGA